MLVSCIRVGLLPRFPAWSSTALAEGACSQTTVRVVSLLHLGAESQLGRQSGCGTGREEACVLLTIHQHRRAAHGARKRGLGS